MTQNSTGFAAFPPVESALEDPNGLLAVGGDLSVSRLVNAYSLGIFPWYESNQPLLWWSPDPRAVLRCENLHVSRSLKRTMRKFNYSLSVDRAFAEVIDQCAQARADGEGTWITAAMQQAYVSLHDAGYAHSFEVWDGERLVGGIYGVAVGQTFSGESMFHLERDTSKIAFVVCCRYLASLGWPLLDCQLMNPHLATLGVEEISRAEFKQQLPGYSAAPGQLAPPAWPELRWRDCHALLREL